MGFRMAPDPDHRFVGQISCIHRDKSSLHPFGHNFLLKGGRFLHRVGLSSSLRCLLPG